MKGKILEFNESSRLGVIAGEDGKRYTLDLAEWKAASQPKAGLAIDFTCVGDKATAVYLDSHTSVNNKKIAAALLAFFLGAFGAHKFYLGYTKQGVIMLLVFLFGFILLGLPSVAIGVIAFIEFVIYLTKSDDEFEKVYVIGHKYWF